MKLRAGIVVALLVVAGTVASAQFKSQADEERRVSEGIINQSPSFLFGWFNPEKFHMRHSFSFSYLTAGGQGLSLGTYTNSMMYEFADNLHAQADVSLSYSPYNSFSTFKDKNDLSQLYLSRAQLTYKPWENMLVQVQYRQLPYTGYYYYSPFYNPWYRESGF